MIDIFLISFVIVILIGMVIFSLSLISAIFRGVPQVGTFGEAYGVIQKEIPKHIKAGKKMVDLGSGTGKMSRFFADTCELEVVGYEVDFGNWLIATISSLFVGSKNVSFRRRNFFRISDEELQSYDFVYIYLFPELMKKIESDLVPRMKPGTTIIVNSFAFPNLKPEETLHRKNGKPIVYIYKV